MSTIEDETGRLWEVLKGDPAYDMVTGLKRRGHQRIVLPVWTLRTGKLPHTLPKLAPMGDAYKLLLDQGAKDGILEDMQRAFLLAATLRDCVAPSPIL